MRATACKLVLSVESGPKPSRRIQAKGPMNSARNKNAVPDKTNTKISIPQRNVESPGNRASIGESQGFSMSRLIFKCCLCMMYCLVSELRCAARPGRGQPLIGRRRFRHRLVPVHHVFGEFLCELRVRLCDILRFSRVGREIIKFRSRSVEVTE